MTRICQVLHGDKQERVKNVPKNSYRIQFCKCWIFRILGKWFEFASLNLNERTLLNFYIYRIPPGCIGLAESIPWNRFLGSLNIYKFGLKFYLPTVSARAHSHKWISRQRRGLRGAEGGGAEQLLNQRAAVALLIQIKLSSCLLFCLSRRCQTVVWRDGTLSPLFSTH